MRSYVVDDAGSVAKLVIPTGETGEGTYLPTWNGHGDALARGASFPVEERIAEAPARRAVEPVVVLRTGTNHGNTGLTLAPFPPTFLGQERSAEPDQTEGVSVRDSSRSEERVRVS